MLMDVAYSYNGGLNYSARNRKRKTKKVKNKNSIKAFGNETNI